MKFHISGVLTVTGFVLACLVGSAQSLAQNAYITNEGPYPFSASTVSVINTMTSTVTATIPVGPAAIGVAATPFGKVYITNLGNNTVSVINSATNMVTATIPVGTGPIGVAASPDGSKVYVANLGFPGTGSVSVIDTATNTITGTIPVGPAPYGVAVSPDGSKVYIANENSATTPGNVSVINTATNTVTAKIPLGTFVDAPGVAVSPDGGKVYVTNEESNFEGFPGVTIINTATNTATATIPCGGCIGVAVSPDGKKVYAAGGGVAVIDAATNTTITTIPVSGFGVSVTPDGSKAFIANSGSNTVSVIDTASNTVTATVPVGVEPLAFGVFIAPPVVQPAPASGSLCNGVYDGTFKGNLTVSAGQDCVFVNGGQVTGNVTEVGGNFVLKGASVDGSLTVYGGGTFTLGPAATVGVNLTIEDLPQGSESNSICGTTVLGNLTFYNNAASVQIGSADALSAPATKSAAISSSAATPTLC